MNSVIADVPQEVRDRIAKMAAILVRGDDLAAVIRMHLMLEQLLSEHYESLLPYPKEVPARIQYSQKLWLALACGLPTELKAPLEKLGNLRNDFAHKEGTELTPKAVADLYACLSEGLKEALQRNLHVMIAGLPAKNRQSYEELTTRDQFTLIAMTLWTDIQAQVHFQRINPKESPSWHSY